MFRFLVQDKGSFLLTLEDTENWLYEDGEDQQKQVYVDRLASLKVCWMWIVVNYICIFFQVLNGSMNNCKRNAS